MQMGSSESRGSETSSGAARQNLSPTAMRYFFYWACSVPPPRLQLSQSPRRFADKVAVDRGWPRTTEDDAYPDGTGARGLERSRKEREGERSAVVGNVVEVAGGRILARVVSSAMSVQTMLDVPQPRSPKLESC